MCLRSAVNFDDVVACTNQDGSASGIALAYTIHRRDAPTSCWLPSTTANTFGMALFGTRPSP